MLPRIALAVSTSLLLVACGDESTAPAKASRDPQVAQALDDPLMTDPDLSSRNEGAAALTVESDFSVPVMPATPEEIARAEAEAAVLVGGADRLVAPNVSDRTADSAFAPFIDGACRAQLANSAVWAARLPQDMPVYPRGHTIAAAGSDADMCRIREVTFATPVAPADVMAFYFAEAARAKLPATIARAGEWLVLAGGDAAMRFEVRARTQGDATVVRLATRERKAP